MMQIAGGCCHLFVLDHLPLAISAPKSPIFMFAEKAATQKLKSALDENQQNPTISLPLLYNYLLVNIACWKILHF